MNTSNTTNSAARDAGQKTHTPLTLHRFAREIVTQCDGDLDDAQLRTYVRFRAEKVLNDIPDPAAEIAALRAALGGLLAEHDEHARSTPDTIRRYHDAIAAARKALAGKGAK